MGSLSLDQICGMATTTGIIQTPTGYAVVDSRPAKLEQGCAVVLSFFGRTQFAKLMGQSFITDDGDVNRAGEDNGPFGKLTVLTV